MGNSVNGTKYRRAGCADFEASETKVAVNKPEIRRKFYSCSPFYSK